MDKEVKLVKKIKCLLRNLGCPRWLHRYGPKTYEVYHHLVALLVRHMTKLSYRRVVKLLRLFDIFCPSKSALQYTAERLPSWLWQRALKLTAGPSHYLVAIDSTCFSRTNPSYHYLRRIDGKLPKVPIKTSLAFDTRRKTFCAARVRVLPAHDLRDAPYLLEQSIPSIGALDKGYDAEALYERAHELHILLMIPAKKKVKRGFYRKKMRRLFRLRTYHRRELVESGIKGTKQKYGSSVSAKKAKTIRQEIYGRLICHNLSLDFLEI